MKTSAVLLAAAICVAALLAPVEGSMRSKPRILKRRLLSALAADVSKLNCGGQTTTCANCTSVLTCSKLGELYRPITTTACPSSTPYCSAGECVAALPDEDCNTPPSPTDDFTCNGDGYFPDPANCKKYYLCVDSLPYEYDCSAYANTAYRHAKAMCVPTSEQSCQAGVTCSKNKIGTYQVWSQDATVYFVCQDTTPANAFVAACPPNHRIDSTGTCELACLREGRLANSDDSSMYYECVYTASNTFSEPLPLTCPTGSTFDKDSERCTTQTS